mmetsp:Transcript_104413/g.319740  ORF Transcript_104413/g.319740 Transcript_104413/m.319740 type:complete len:227 (+) Transcript_104413:417-1097(+)
MNFIQKPLRHAETTAPSAREPAAEAAKYGRSCSSVKTSAADCPMTPASVEDMPASSVPPSLVRPTAVSRPSGVLAKPFGAGTPSPMGMHSARRAPTQSLMQALWMTKFERGARPPSDGWLNRYLSSVRFVTDIFRITSKSCCGTWIHRSMMYQLNSGKQPGLNGCTSMRRAVTARGSSKTLLRSRSIGAPGLPDAFGGTTAVAVRLSQKYPSELHWSVVPVTGHPS